MTNSRDRTLIYDNIYRAKIGRNFVVVFLLIVIPFVFEGARAGFMAHFYDFTPELFGVMNSNEIGQENAWIIMLVASITTVLLCYFLVIVYWNGLADRIEIDLQKIYLHWNGKAGKIQEFEKSRVRRFTVKIEPFYNQSSGMAGKAYRANLYYDVNGEEKKFFLVRNTKYESERVVKELKSWLANG